MVRRPGVYLVNPLHMRKRFLYDRVLYPLLVSYPVICLLINVLLNKKIYMKGELLLCPVI